MGLQLRVRHALGARVVEVEPRDAQRRTSCAMPIAPGGCAGADWDVALAIACCIWMRINGLYRIMGLRRGRM
jgi:hypothetical protein